MFVSAMKTRKRRAKQDEESSDEPIDLKFEGPQLVQMVKVSGGFATTKDFEEFVTSYLSELENTEHDSLKEVKEKIKHRLIFSSFAYKSIPEPKDPAVYFSKMSELLALYIRLEVHLSKDSLDLESRKGAESREKTISGIVTILYSVLDHSQDHVLDTVLRAKAPKKGTSQKEIDIYSSLYSIVARRARNPVSDFTYIRLVILFKMWMKLVQDDPDEKSRIAQLASATLRPPPGFLERCSTLPRFIPKPPDDVENVNEFFIKEKFNAKKTSKKLLEFSAEAAVEQSMFPNLSVEPRILNPTVIEFGPLPAPDAPIEDLPTNGDLSEDLWLYLRRNDSATVTSVYEDVSNSQRNPCKNKTSSTRVLNFLRRLQNRDHSRKSRDKKKNLRQGSDSRTTQGGPSQSTVLKRKSDVTSKKKGKKVSVHASYSRSSGLRKSATQSVPYVAISPYTGNSTK